MNFGKTENVSEIIGLFVVASLPIDVHFDVIANLPTAFMLSVWMPFGFAVGVSNNFRKPYLKSGMTADSCNADFTVRLRTLMSENLCEGPNIFTEQGILGL